MLYSLTVWSKGESGNRTGRPSGSAGLAKYIADRTNNGQELIDRLIEMSRDSKTPMRERLQATQLLIDRGYGRAMQPSEIMLHMESSTFVYPADWAQLERAQRVEFLQGHRREKMLK